MSDFELARHSNRLGAGRRGNGGNSACDGGGGTSWSTEARAIPDTKPPGVPAGIKPESRKPGGRHRAGQRAPGRCPPNPRTEVDPRVILGVLKRSWLTSSGEPNLWRVRGLAVIAVALASPAGTTSLDLAAMSPADVWMLPMPASGRRWVRRWLRVRSHFVSGGQAELSSWVAAPPASNGRARMIGWAASQTLHRARAPAWRIGSLLKATWPT